MKTRLLSAMLCILALACGRQAPEVVPSPRVETKPTFVFMDTNAFDRSLSSALGKTPPAVTITFLGQVTINEIPERLERWLAEAESHKGSIALAPDPEVKEGGKSLMAIGGGVSIAVTTYVYVKRFITYRPVQHYNVKIYHVPGEADITRIVFTRKPPEPKGKPSRR